MKTDGKFILLSTDELVGWLGGKVVNRPISLVQEHHTYTLNYSHFNGDNYFALCKGMERAHIERGFSEIAQNFTTFPDGKIVVCRDLNTVPAGIKGANSEGVCIENVANFDAGENEMSPQQKSTILFLTAALLKKFSLKPSDLSVVYHHWFDLSTGKRLKDGETGVTKTCPGTAFFGGNTIKDFNTNFLPLLIEEMEKN